MITIGKLHVENGLTYRNLDMDFDRPGLHLVVGQNLDASADESNGSGKSNSFELLSYVLYGNCGKRIKASDVINWYSEDGYRSVLDLCAHDSKIQIKQWRGDKAKGNDIEVIQNDTPLKSNLKETQAKISELIGLSETEFRSLCYLAQRAEHPFLTTGKASKTKRDLLSSVYGLRFDEYLKIAKDSFNEVNEKIKHLDVDLSSRLSVIQQQFDQLPKTKDAEGRITQIDELITSLESGIKDIQTKLEVNSANNALWNELDNARRKLTELVAPEQIDDADALVELFTALKGKVLLKAKRDELQAKLGDVDGDETELREGLKNADQQIAEINSAINSLKSIERNVAQIQKLVREKDIDPRSVVFLETSLIQAESDLRQHESDAKLLKSKLELIRKGKCPTCSREFDDAPRLIPQLETDLSRIESVLGQLIKDVTDHKWTKEVHGLVSLLPDNVDILGHSQVLADYNASLAEWIEYRKGVDTTLKTVLAMAKIRAELDALEEPTFTEDETPWVEAGARQIDDEVRRIKASVDAIKRYTTTHSQISDQVHGLESKVAGSERIGDLSELRSEVSGKQSEMKLLVAEKSELKQKLEQRSKLTGEIKAIQLQLSGLDELKDERRKYEILQFVFGPKGFEYRIKQILDSINQKLEVYIGILFPEFGRGFRCYLQSEGDGVTLYTKKLGHEGTLDFASGGESHKIALAVMMAMRDFLPPRKTCNVLILDEFDASLSDHNRELVIQALRYHHSLHPQTSIWVITHSSSLQSQTRYWDSVMTVQMQNGISQIV